MQGLTPAQRRTAEWLRGTHGGRPADVIEADAFASLAFPNAVRVVYDGYAYVLDAEGYTLGGLCGRA